jgi:hypothetical protein
MTDTPEMQFQLVSSHGLLAILEVLESKPSRDVVMNLLKLTNLVRAFEDIVYSGYLTESVPT